MAAAIQYPFTLLKLFGVLFVAMLNTHVSVGFLRVKKYGCETDYTQIRSFPRPMDHGYGLKIGSGPNFPNGAGSVLIFFSYSLRVRIRICKTNG